MASTIVDLPQSVYGTYQNQAFNFHEEQNASQQLEGGLPEGFPSLLSTSLAWAGSEIVEKDYVYLLTSKDKLEIDSALAYFKELGLDGDLVNPNNFPLPSLARTLQNLSLQLHRGNGFFLIRGLDYEKYSVEDGTIVFLAIQSFIAEKRGRQDEAGNMIVHIIQDDFVSSCPFRNTHPRHSNSRLLFHTDPVGDITAFQTRQIALEGGDCILSSAYTIYNELAFTRPDIIRTLAKADWPFVSPHSHQRPILFYQDSDLIINFSMEHLAGSSCFPHPKDLSKCTTSQLEALDTVQKIAEKNSLRFATRVGDLHFINNLAILHRRDTFVNDPATNRHLARLWLRNEALGWRIPAPLKVDWDAVFEGDAERAWNIEPMPEAFFPLRKYGL